MRDATANSYQDRKEMQALPFILSFITIRPERFGGIIFNPYLGIEMNLDHVEIYVASFCNGNNSMSRIEESIKEYFDLSPDDCRDRVSSTIKKIRDIHALTFLEARRSSEPALPKIPSLTNCGLHLSALKTVIWDTTYACNLSCPHCLTNSGFPTSTELDTDQAFRLIDILSNAKIFSLTLSGGEPLIRPDILALIKKISQTKMRFDIVTNGVDISDEIMGGLKNSRIFDIQMSIDGIGKDHDRFRGRKGAFDAACQNVQRLKDNGIAVSISTTVTKKNVGSLDRIVDLALELDCSGFRAIPFIPIGRGRVNRNDLKLDLQDLLLFTQRLVDRHEELLGKLRISVETCYSFLLKPPPEKILSNGSMGCSAGYDTLSVGADGTAYPCSFLHDFPLGNLLTESFSHLWNRSPILNALRSLQKFNMKESCKSCPYSPNLCRGGCRAAAHLEYGDFCSSDPFCFYHLRNAEN